VKKSSLIFDSTLAGAALFTMMCALMVVPSSAHSEGGKVRNPTLVPLGECYFIPPAGTVDCVESDAADQSGYKTFLCETLMVCPEAEKAPARGR